MTWQVFIRDRTNLAGTPDGQLFNVEKVIFLRSISETGSAQVIVPLKAQDLIDNRALLFDEESVLDFIYGGTRRFRMRLNGHEIIELEKSGKQVVSFFGTDFSVELDEMVALPFNYPTLQSSFRETTGSGLEAWATLFDDSRTAGGGELLTLGFGANDSAANPWAATTDIETRLDVGTTLKATADALIIPGEAEWWCDEAGILQALPVLGSDVSAAVRLRTAVHQGQRIARVDRRSLINQSFVIGPDGTIEADEDVTSSTAHGGRQTFIKANTNVIADRQAIALAVISNLQDPTQALEVQARAFEPGAELWVDWDLGDTIAVDVEGIRDSTVLSEDVRVAAYTVETDMVTTAVNLVLGTQSQIEEVAFDRRLQQVLNAQKIGMQMAGGVAAALDVEVGGGTGIDPTGLIVNDRAGAAVDEAALQISWTAPAAAEIAEVVSYEVEVDDNIDTEIRRERTSQTNQGIWGLIPNTAYDIIVYSLNVLGERVGSVTQLGFTTATDSTLPAAPTGLALLGTFSALRAVWAANTEPDVANGRGLYRFQVDSDSLFGTPDIDQITGSTIVDLTGLVPQTLYYVRVLAIDSSGNEGAWSASVNTSAGQVGSGDLEDDSVITTKIADLAATNAKIADLNVDKLTAGTMTAQAIVIAGGASGYLESSGFIAGTTGWRIDGNGDVEFNAGIFRGSLEAGEIHIPNQGTAASMHVNTVGDFWLGATTFGAAKFSVDSGTGDVLSAGNMTLDGGAAKFRTAPGVGEFVEMIGDVAIVNFETGDGAQTSSATIDAQLNGIEANWIISLRSPEMGTAGGGIRSQLNLLGRSGVDRSQFSGTGDDILFSANLPDGLFTVNGARIRFGESGSESLPLISMGGDSDSGIYRPADNVLGFSVGGNNICKMTTTNFETYKSILSIDDGDVGLTLRDSNAGTHAAVTKQIRFERSDGAASAFISMQGGHVRIDSFLSGQNILLLNAGNISAEVTSQGVAFEDGSEGNPSVYFRSDFNSGMYWQSSDLWHLVAGGDITAKISNDAFTVGDGDSTKLRVQDGTELLPSITSENDLNTGIWWAAADDLRVVAGGNWVASFQASNTFLAEAAGSVYIRNTTDGALVLRETSTTGDYTKYLRFEDSAGNFDGFIGFWLGDMKLSTIAGVNLIFSPGGADAWQINNSTGDLRPSLPGGSDLGTSANYIGTMHALLTNSTTNAQTMNRNSSSRRLQYNGSSRRWKANEADWVIDFTAALRGLQPKTYLYGDDANPNVGLIAEDIEPVLPEVISCWDEAEVDERGRAVEERDHAAGLKGDGGPTGYSEQMMLTFLVGVCKELDDRLTAAGIA